MRLFKLSGPKGGPLVKRANLARVKALLPNLVKRFGRVTVSPAVPLPVDKRTLIVQWARWGVAHEPEIHYAETRPMPHWLEPLPVTIDCSGFATLCYRHAGCPDPNGLNYDGSGYTGTLLAHGKHVWKPQPGDLVIYGPGEGVHVAVVVEAGPDPLTVSHGEERGPELVRVSQDNRQPIRYRSYL